MWQVVTLEDQPGYTDAPCEWAIVYCDPLDAETYPVTGWETQAAIKAMYIASGRQFGVCEVTERPCTVTELENCTGDWSYTPWSPWWGTVGPDSYFLLSCKRCGPRTCSCSEYPTLKIPRKRVVEVSNITIDGTVLDPSAYVVRGNKVLRIDGEGWPSCQDWGVAAGEAGSWSITYKYGRPVPPQGAIATGKLLEQMALACSENDSCMLPDRVQEVTRQGITAVFLDPQELLTDGLFGVPVVDQWIQSINPNRMARPARVIRADDPNRKQKYVRS